jgi:hypothetical protein
MSEILSAALNPVLQQWPVVAIILAIGWYVWREFKDCLIQHKSNAEWMRRLIEEHIKHDQK